MEYNRFLADFVRMRKQLDAPPPAPKPAKKEDRSQNPTFKSICEEMPPKSDVLEYFRQRIDEIVAENS